MTGKQKDPIEEQPAGPGQMDQGIPGDGTRGPSSADIDEGNATRGPGFADIDDGDEGGGGGG